MSKLSKALKLIRQYHRLKQNETADRLKISASYLSEIENGSKQPTLDLLDNYSREFQIPVSTILVFSEENNNQIKSNGELKISNKALKILQWIYDVGSD